MSNPCNFSTLCNTLCSDGPSIQLFHCDRDTSSQLSLLQCSEKIPDRWMQFYDIPEAFPILYRTGIFSIDSSALKLNIIATHREYFGIQWRRKQICYTGHSETRWCNADRMTEEHVLLWLCASCIGWIQDRYFQQEQVIYIFITLCSYPTECL